MPVFNMHFATLAYRNHLYFLSWPTENTCGITGIKITLFRKAEMFHHRTGLAMSCSKGQRASSACLAHLSSPQPPSNILPVEGGCWWQKLFMRARQPQGKCQFWTNRLKSQEAPGAHLGPSSCSLKEKSFSSTMKCGPAKEKRHCSWRKKINWCSVENTKVC